MRQLGLVILGVALAGSLYAADDPIVGCWRLDPEFGSYQHTIDARADGSFLQMILGKRAAGTWTRQDRGRYKVDPGGENDYWRIEGGILGSYDQEGLIRKFNPARCE